MGARSSDGTERSADDGWRAAVTGARQRGPKALVPLLQVAVAATLAWLIALSIGGHADPFFAPISVVVALSSPLGERGSNAVRVVAGVILGIVVGELTVLVLGDGAGRIALATLAALVVARLLRGPRLVMIQAAASAILVVAAAEGEAGLHRLIDAGIGAAVALTFSQIAFSPEPVALVRNAATAALSRMADALDLTADAATDGAAEPAERAITELRNGRDGLGELARLRKASGRVARHSAIWRSRIEPVVRENENVGHIDLLDASCLVLARTVIMGASGDDATRRAVLGACIRRLGHVPGAMAEDLGDRATRQDAAEGALAVALDLESFDEPTRDPIVGAIWMVVTDVMIVAGVPVDDAIAAVRRGAGELEVPTPPGTPRLPFNTPARLARRRRRRPPRVICQPTQASPPARSASVQNPGSGRSRSPAA